MESYFDVGDLSLERLLKEWRWLCPQTVSLLARNAFGDLYLREKEGKILRLDVAVGQIQQVAESEEQFRKLASTNDKQEQWFAASYETAAVRRGLKPGVDQCIAFKTPLVFAESGTPNSVYIADLYEQVSFLGDLHRQLKDLPDGAKVQLRLTE